MRFGRVLIFLCAALLFGCGASSKPQPDGQAPLNGNWQLALALTSGTKFHKSQSGFLQQTGSKVTGNMQMYAGDGACPGVGTATGSLTGQNVSLTINIPGQSETLTGTLDPSGTTMSGNYALLASGCGNSESGVWTAILVPQFSGNFTANMTAANGTQWTAPGSISQGAGGGNVSAPVSGSMTSTDPITTDSCFSSATFTGNVSGTTLIWNVADTTGVQIGQFTLIFDPASKSASGSYRIDPMPGLPKGTTCRPGETGTADVTFP